MQIDIDVGYCPLSINVAMPAGLLINEMLTNALKYAFVGRSGGQLKLICKQEGGRVTVIVSDDGVGLGEDQEWPSPRKLGALILQTLKENARDVVFRAESIRGQGTWFTLMFDAAPERCRTRSSARCEWLNLPRANRFQGFSSGPCRDKSCPMNVSGRLRPSKWW